MPMLAVGLPHLFTLVWNLVRRPRRMMMVRRRHPVPQLSCGPPGIQHAHGGKCGGTLMSRAPVQDQDRVKADCYARGERSGMVRWQQFRAVTLHPLLVFLAGLGVRPDHLTLVSAVIGLSFCPLYFWSKPLALAMLALHVLLDGLDGPLARYTNTASRRGSLSDSMADQCVVVASTVTLMSMQVVGILAGSVYIVAYTVVILFAMVRNALSIPYSWLFRPRFVVYLWFAVETCLLPGTIDCVLWFFNALLLLKVVTGFAQIRRHV